MTLGCPEPLTLGQPNEFATYFKVFYERELCLLIKWAPFGDRLTGLSWFLTRYEAIKDQSASSRASEYSDVWHSLLAPRDLHTGLKTRSKLTPSTEVYSP